MEITCDNCGKVFNRKPSRIKKYNYCCKECRHKAKTVTANCETCGKEVTRCKSQILKHVFCSLECAKGYLAFNFSSLAKKHNPTRMTEEIKTKIRNARLNPKSTSYPKYYGRHEHRIVAEQILGRPLRKGEVVHHIDGDKRNNHPINLMVFKSQADHALWHKNEKLDPSKNYE